MKPTATRPESGSRGTSPPGIIRPIARCALALAAVVSLTEISLGDEGGVSFWLPGTFGSLAATPGQPGWSATLTYYHATTAAGPDVARSREFALGRIPDNLSANVDAHLNATEDLVVFEPSYGFATPVFGQAALSLTTIFGNTNTSLAGTVTGTLTTPGGMFPFMRSDSISSSVTAFGDLAPQFSLSWNSGANNYLAYLTGDVPVGQYSSTSLSNLGFGHGAIDAGGGYTYFD